MQQCAITSTPQVDPGPDVTTSSSQRAQFRVRPGVRSRRTDVRRRRPQADLTSGPPALHIIGISTINDEVWTGHGIVGITIKVEVNLLDTLLHCLDERLKFAQTILVRFAALDTGQGHDAVIDDPADVCGFGRRWA